MIVNNSSLIFQTPESQLQNERVPSKTLQQQDFVKLLVSQLANQNPLKPQDSSSILTQMTQIASISSLTTMQDNLKQLRTDQQLTLGQSLVNKIVEVADESGATVTGVVQKVVLNKGTVELMINNKNYPINNLQSIVPSELLPSGNAGENEGEA